MYYYDTKINFMILFVTNIYTTCGKLLLRRKKRHYKIHPDVYFIDLTVVTLSKVIFCDAC